MMADKKKDNPAGVPPRPEIDFNKCTGCALCVKICPRYVFKIENKKAVYANIPGAYCNMCGHCIAVCPEGALVYPFNREPEPPQPGPDELPSPESLQLLFRARRAVRMFKPDPIPEDILNEILEAGRYTATGGNQQNIQYTVIPTPEETAAFRDRSVPVITRTFERFENKFYFAIASLLMGKKNAEVPRNYIPLLRLYHKMKELGEDRLMYNAAAVMLVHTDKGALGADFASSAALYNCSLMAHLLGIGCCFNAFIQIAVNKNNSIREMLGIPKNHRCHGAMIMGYQNIKFRRLVTRNEPDVNWVNIER